MAWNLALQNFTAYCLIFCRLGGMIFFNPFLSRKNVPSNVRAGLTLAITIILAPTITPMNLEILSAVGLLMVMIKEMFVGMLCGMIIQFFYYMIFMAGDVMDTGFGLAMAKVFDPATNIQLSVSGNLFQLSFILYLFLTRCDLLLIQIIATSYRIFPLGGTINIQGISGAMIDIFSLTFRMAIQLAAPFVAAAFILEMAMGVLMKLVPQISIFAIHFQVKIILGILLLLAFSVPVTDFLQYHMNTMFDTMNDVLRLLQN